MQHFAIAPWEFPGAAYNAAPHAVAKIEVSGQTREFGLKMRDGVLYFKEDARAGLGDHANLLRRFEK